MRIDWLLLGILLVLSSSCAPQPGTSPADAAIERWQGQPISRVIDSWGPPTEMLATNDGQVYHWQASAYRSSSSPFNLVSGRSNRYGSMRRLKCQAVFTVDGNGLVGAAVWQGYECQGSP